MNWGTIRYFSKAEFACQCGECGSDGEELNLGFVARLDYLRATLGIPLRITSGYRCPTHNKRVSSTGLNGPHTTGRAADIAVYGADAFRLLREATSINITGIGLQQKGAQAGRYVHLDDLDTEPRPWVWTY